MCVGILWGPYTSKCKSEKGNFVVIKLLEGRRACLAFGQIVQLFPSSLWWSRSKCDINLKWEKKDDLGVNVISRTAERHGK